MLGIYAEHTDQYAKHTVQAKRALNLDSL